MLVGLLLLSPTLGTAQQVPLAGGTVFLPAGFAHQSQMGKDSWVGRIAAQDSSLTIQYDIGFLAGARTTPTRRGEFVWFVEHEVNGHLAYTGMFMRDGQRRISTTVLGDINDPARSALFRADALPANFEASVKGERELATYMAIVSRYRPRAGAAQTPSQNVVGSFRVTRLPRLEAVLMLGKQQGVPIAVEFVGAGAFEAVTGDPSMTSSMPQNDADARAPQCLERRSQLPTECGANRNVQPDGAFAVIPLKGTALLVQPHHTIGSVYQGRHICSRLVPRLHAKRFDHL
jgi:hypothetical protein